MVEPRSKDIINPFSFPLLLEAKKRMIKIESEQKDLYKLSGDDRKPTAGVNNDR